MENSFRYIYTKEMAVHSALEGIHVRLVDIEPPFSLITKKTRKAVMTDHSP